VALRFFSTVGQSIESSVWKIPFLDPVTKGIVQHVVLSATDIIRRDVSILIDTMWPAHPERMGNQIRMGIRICRMHWFGPHFKKVCEEFKKQVGIDLMSKIETMRTQDAFPDLMAAMFIQTDRGNYENENRIRMMVLD
jgi:hypothetical protein